MAREELLDSARHKLRLARYHATALGNVLAAVPPDDPEDELRVALEAHLEGLAYTGTAAAEKTIRSLAADEIQGQKSVEQMLVFVIRDAGLEEDDLAFARRFESWWVGRGRNSRYAQAARDLRNDAAHAFYGKTLDGPDWVMSFRNGNDQIEIGGFIQGYLDELEELEQLVGEAEALAAAEAAQ